MPVLELWDAVWRVPNAIMFVIGGVILAWAFGSGFMAFTGSQKSGLPLIAPRPGAEDETSEDTEVVDEPEDAPADA